MQALKQYQQEAVKSLIQKEKMLLLARVGSGKTRIAIEAFNALRATSRVKHALVLGTKRICNIVWPNEVMKWAPALSIRSLAGLTESQRLMAANGRPDILACNYENLPWLVKTYGSQLPEMYDMLIVDESSKLRTMTSARFRAIRPLLSKWRSILAMTGTPMPNYIQQVWGQAYLIDQGKTLGKYYQGFLQYWFTPEELRFGHRTAVKWHLKPGAYEDILGRLTAIAHVVNPDDVEAPPVEEIDIEIQPPASLGRLLPEIRHMRQLQADEFKAYGATFVKHGHYRAAKLLQLSSGAVYRDEGNGWVRIHDEKLDALEDIIDEAQGEPIIVVYQFQHEAERIMERWNEARLLDNDPETVAAWNRGEIPILLLHPQGAGHGLNLQDGGSLMVWFSPTFDAELYAQAVGRLARTGQTKNVKVFRLIMKHTWDAYAYDVVAGRIEADQAMIEALI